jgi:hypothetical protein
MSRKAWKDKLKVAKKKIQATDVLENETFELRVKEAAEAGDMQLADQIRAEQSKAMKSRDFSVTGKKRTPEIKDQELYEENKKSNYKKRKGIYQWAEGGREAARGMRVNRKKNVDSPVATTGSLATLSRDLDRWEMGYGTEISLKKGSVVMPVSDTYIHREKKCVTVMAGANMFKGVPVAVLRPVDEE